MGTDEVLQDADSPKLRAFMRALLADLHALEIMIEEGQIETGVRRIGAEQEMFLVDESFRPARAAQAVLAGIDDPRLTTELALYNLEANLQPQIFGGACLSNMEQELDELITMISKRARECGADVLLTGILPTLRKEDLTLESMTPKPRYFALNRAATRMRGGDFHIVIKGLDELALRHDNVMLESANTSFQIHFQVAPGEFAHLYNLAQLVAAPVIAAAVNSPVLLGRKLWQETRVALFQDSVDTRSHTHHSRRAPPRVSFGDKWLEDSILEIYREDIARYRLILAIELDEDPEAELARGEIPRLSALRLHTGTVWRWNRACYGVEDGQAHLRIENRVLPAGPTVLDEMANAAFFFGLMASLGDEYGEVSKRMPFEDAKGNFLAASQHGLNAQFTWVDGQAYTASDLILQTLLPTAREGLKHAGIVTKDIDRYLGTVEQRVQTSRTGSQWALRSLAGMAGQGTEDVRVRTLTAAMWEGQRSGQPVHTWPLAHIDESKVKRESYLKISQIMTTDLFTVGPEDLVDLAASMMEWKHIRHVPVEDDQGRLVGLVTHRSLLRLVARGQRERDTEQVVVRNIMLPNPITAGPETPTLEVIETMRRDQVSCIPVVDANHKLLGLVTTHDLMEVARKLLSDYLKGGDGEEDDGDLDAPPAEDS